MRLLIAMLILLLTGCAGMPSGDDRSVAERDHGRCTEQGHEWPSNAYDGCRWTLQERRHRRTWDNMRLMERSNIDAAGMPVHEHYRPLPRDRFRCEQRTTIGDHTWIDCRVVER